jgi:hypothetical protein
MHAPITVNYVPDGGDWTVTVTDEEQTQNATASGLIAARDQADQIVDKMVPNQIGRTVVHLLEGDAVAFTDTYLRARLGLTPIATELTPDVASGPAPGTTAAETTETEPQPDSTPALTDPSGPLVQSAPPGQSGPSRPSEPSDLSKPSAAADLSAPDGTVPSQPTSGTAIAAAASATQPPASATSADAPSAEAPAPQAETPTIAPLAVHEGDKGDKLTEVAGSPSNQVN